MALHLLVFGLLLTSVFISVEAQGNTTLTCRICNNANNLNDCIGKETCGHNEQCYIDELITSQLRIVFNGGCRSTDICNGAARLPGKRVESALLACSHCCNTSLQNSSSSNFDIECNAKLCGIKPDNTTLTCRSCNNAVTLNDCIGKETCRHNEECYTDEIITMDLRIVYNGGCRSTSACNTLTHTSGKRAEGGLIACSHCCNTTLQNSSSSNFYMECNAKLCGIKTSNRVANQCYYCGKGQDANQGAVRDPNICRNVTSCRGDEVCRATTSSIAGNTTYNFGCYNTLKCQLLTKAALIQYGPASIDLGLSNGVGRKRQTILCDICCGDDLCNNAECHIVRERLIGYANANRLDYNTLRLKP